MNKNIKLVFDVRMKKFSGIGVYISNLIYKIDCLEGFESKTEVYGFRELYSFREVFWLYLKIPNCNIFWSPHWNIPIFPIKAKKRMVTIHDVYHLVFSNQFSLPKRLYAKLMINHAISRSDIILTVSEFSKSELQKHTGTKKQIHVVHNGIGIDPTLYNDLLRSPVDFPYVLYVGNVKPHKNLSRALSAFESLGEEYSNYKFLIVGKKENFITGDHAFIDRALQNERVIFTGFIEESLLVGYYKHATLLFFPSLYEGFGLPPLEAQACGTPCLVSNVASLPEVCGASVLYCDPYNVQDMTAKLSILLNDSGLQNKLVQKGFENIKRFSWERSAQKIMKIIEENI